LYCSPLRPPLFPLSFCSISFIISHSYLVTCYSISSLYSFSLTFYSTWFSSFTLSTSSPFPVLPFLTFSCSSLPTCSSLSFASLVSYFLSFFYLISSSSFSPSYNLILSSLLLLLFLLHFQG
jgi:hypothetical protein